MKISRRGFVYGGGAIAAAAIGVPLFRALRAGDEHPWRSGPFGPLRPDPRGVLDLPEGFSYRVLQRPGVIMSDGLRAPARPDGMACFRAPGDDALVLMRNHENPAHVSMLGPWTGAPAPEAWSPEGMGGVSRLVLDPDTLAVRSSNLVLGGTQLNCSGGPSPWGWLSCEETFGARNGYVFACDPAADRIAPPVVVRGYGKFRHEAVAIDPADATAILTEDREDGCLYRFVPADPARPFEGELFALAVRGRDRLDTATSMHVGDRVEIAWVPVREADPVDDEVRLTARRERAATFARGEGIAFERGPSGPRAVFTATTGGPAGTGQIFELRPEGDGGELALLAQSERRAELEMPDNVAISPHGIVFLCEDGPGRNHVRGIDREGRLFDFARNALSESELAGVCFSPDGRAMFVNIQHEGLTLAIRGPFEELT